MCLKKIWLLNILSIGVFAIIQLDIRCLLLFLRVSLTSWFPKKCDKDVKIKLTNWYKY